MRILGLAFSLALLGGCVDELGDTRGEPTQEGVEDIDPSDDTNTGNNLPDPRCGEPTPDGKDDVSRKKADGSCF